MKGKHIVVGITGSIAAYKTCTLVRLFVKAGAEVQVVMTPSAKEFVTPLTLATLSRHAVVSEFFDRRDGSWHSHVELGTWADVMLVAPASASTLGKMAHGIADNMLLTTYLSMKAPVFVAPAMDLDMYAHPATQENLRLLQRRGVGIIEPGEGELASALVGKGRMEEPEQIFRHMADFFRHTAESKAGSGLYRGKLLITAGPTHEYIDPVRFIGNCSTGKMGFALAEAAAEAGFEVELVSGPTALSVRHPGIHRTDVVSAEEMFEAARQVFPTCRAAIFCAAVADFTPETTATNKIKREATGESGKSNYAQRKILPASWELPGRPDKSWQASLWRPMTKCCMLRISWQGSIWTSSCSTVCAMRGLGSDMTRTRWSSSAAMAPVCPSP